MESKLVYEDSYAELNRVFRQPQDAGFRIDMNKLDMETKGEMITAINKVISKRRKEIEGIIFGVQ